MIGIERAFNILSEMLEDGTFNRDDNERIIAELLKEQIYNELSRAYSNKPNVNFDYGLWDKIIKVIKEHKT